jgi:hypothetical protein
MVQLVIVTDSVRLLVKVMEVTPALQVPPTHTFTDMISSPVDFVLGCSQDDRFISPCSAQGLQIP